MVMLEALCRNAPEGSSPPQNKSKAVPIATREFTCPACGGRDTRFRQINSGGSGTKCETWGSSNAPEVVLRLGVKGADRERIDRFGSELVPLVTSGPPGVTGFAGGRPKATEIIGYWPALVSKERITTNVEVFESRRAEGAH